MSDKVAVVEHRGVLDAVPTQETAGVLDLMQRAVAAGMAPESMERLVALYERMADREAEAKMADALAEFQAQCPPIPKSSTAEIVTKSGGKFRYRYAELDAIAAVVNPLLSKLGMSYSWDSEIVDGCQRCVCTLRHKRHTISATFTAPIDGEARMNVTQRGGAALTYAKRQALVQVLGLTMTEEDHDGGAIGNGNAAISANQAADLECLIEEVKADRAKFLAWLEVGSVEEIRASDYERAVEGLQKKGRK